MAVEEVVLEGDIAKEDALKLLQQHGSADKLTLSNCRKLTTTDIQALIEAINSGLNSVTIKNCNIIDDDTLEKLAACCPKLTDVTLNGKFKKLTERGTINFAKSCQELKLFSVVLSETDESEEQEGDEEVEWGLTDNFLSGLSENTCPTLEHFGFSGFTGVTANGLLGFLWKVSPTLASLDCSEVPIITDTECREIAGICPGLTSINFSYCNITDKGVEELCLKCHLLNHIDFCGCNELTDNAVKSIATHCKKITNLKLGWCLKITETSLEALANECLSLGHVDIRHCSVKHIPFDFIKIESLSSLQVDGCTGLKCPPLNIAMKGVKPAREFLEECDLHHMCRVAFVGSEGSGKSSLSMCVQSSSMSVADVATEGVHVTLWKPFHKSNDECRVDKSTLSVPVDDKWDNLTVELWDSGGRQCLFGLQPLFLTDQTLYVMTFNVNNPMEIKLMPNWFFLVQTKAPGSPVILVGTNADDHQEDYTPIGNKVLKAVQEAEEEHCQEIQTELNLLREKKEDACVQARITKLESIINCRPKLPERVLFVSSIKGLGITEIQNEIFRMLLDASLFPHLLHKVDIHITYLHAEILKLREDKVVVIPWDNYLSIASEAGLTDKADVDAATELLECRGCIVVLKIPASTQDHGPTRTVCVNPGVLFNCLACMHNETDPREFVPRFIKAGFVDRYWPTNTKPNDWTLRSAVDDIVSKGLIREAVIPLCFQAVHLSEDEICKIITLCRNIGVLVEGAPKGSYEVELILAYYKNLSVFKRYFIPLQHKLPPDSESPNVWPKAVPEGHIQVGWRFKFPDEVSAECSTLVIAACRNYKMNSELHGYWERGLILKVGDVLVKISREAAFLDVIGRCKITHGSKQALNMTWYNLAQFFYVADTLLSNYSGLSPEIMVPIEGCSRPKHKSLFELIKDYNVEPSHLANYRWFLPPAGLNAEVHTQIPSDTSSWLATIARKSTMFVSYHSDHQDEIKLLRMSLEHSGFNCVGDWSLVGQGQDLTEKRRQSIMGSSIILAFISPNYLEWSRAQQDINTALENNKPVIALLFDKSNWTEVCNDTDFGKQLSGHATCLDFDGGSGKALSHQFDQAQLLQLITHCNATLYGTGDIHPPEPPRSPEVTAQVSHDKRVESIHDSTFLSAKPDEDVVKSEQQHHQNQQVPRVEVTVASESKESIVESTKDQDAKIREMAASAVAAAVAGATAQHISKKETSPEAIKAAAAAAEVGQAVLDGDSDAAAQAVVKVARIVEETSKGSTQNNRTVQNGSVSSRPPQSSTCTIL
ncbi:uncharacterized protein LOC5520491 [Nematostella vectensis]|uniref:uncharacterized protein LOC5520491 n=1 Tax=Nematostella vectensis TaxID=45351 RepID=UPI0020770E9B|nr:uncharacterized protein LOC5520491 [Nematostella vectensis]